MVDDPLSQRNSMQDQQINKLPLNLFLSPAEYNKTLITYGKNRKKQTPSITDGMENRKSHSKLSQS
jgi:hypothetical protein